MNMLVGFCSEAWSPPSQELSLNTMVPLLEGSFLHAQPYSQPAPR
jgi:hypothetical protein